MICKFKLTNCNIEMAYTKTTSNIKPHSYHVVYQIKA